MFHPTTDVLPKRASSPVVKVRDLAYLRWDRPDLPRAVAYYADFGLTISARRDAAVYFRGVLPAHHCWILEPGRRAALTGVGFVAASRDDLVRLAKLPGASAIEPTGEPGGGERVRLADPSGLRVDVVFGRQELEPLPHRALETPNSPLRKTRINRAHPVVSGPAEVFRLGHVVLTRQEYGRNAQWYCDTLGLIPTDVLLAPDCAAVLAFLRCDRGAEPADHHTVVIALGPEDGFEHSAFEVLDAEAVGAGAEWLQRKGHRQLWGVGRHILGSQVFDYELDPDGFKVEHFADGDLFDADYPTGYHPMSKEGLYQWGPLPPPEFINDTLTPRRLLSIVDGLRRRDEFTLRKLLSLKKAMSAPARPRDGLRK
jgi:catechol 2,3-dioxygenase-like lactoylglutathione lyase family enzyme